MMQLCSVPVLQHEAGMDSQIHPRLEDRILQPVEYMWPDVGFWVTEAAVKKQGRWWKTTIMRINRESWQVKWHQRQCLGLAISCDQNKQKKMGNERKTNTNNKFNLQESK